jgi:hypothetical protein
MPMTVTNRRRMAISPLMAQLDLWQIQDIAAGIAQRLPLPGPDHAQRVLLMRLALLIVVALVAAIPALAHSWYPLACCGNMDCFPVACDQLVETGSGWFYVPTGNLFKREQVQPSQDHHCHVCLGRGGDHRSICAFIVRNV